MTAKSKLVLFLAFVLLSPLIIILICITATALVCNGYTGVWIWILLVLVVADMVLLAVSDEMHRNVFGSGLSKVLHTCADGRLLAYFEGKKHDKKENKGD